MKTRTPCTLFSIILVLQLPWLFTPERSSGAGTESVIDHSKGIKFQRSPLRFEINEGQIDPQVRFTARDRDGIAYLTSDGAVFQISRSVGTPESKPRV